VLLLAVLLLLLLQQLDCPALLLPDHLQQVSWPMLSVVCCGLLHAKGLLLIRVPEPPEMVPLHEGEWQVGVQKATRQHGIVALSVCVQ
jgi:hypothetical protein